MKLYLNKTSPYARLVLVVAHEKSLAKEIEAVWTDPWSDTDTLAALNPYSKVPVLVARDGEPLTESQCICEYLDDIGGGRPLLPLEGAHRLSVLRKVGLARGLIDAAFGVTIDRRFHGTKPDSSLAARWLAALGRGLAMLERQTPAFDAATADLGDLTLAVGLSYMEFRLPEVAWRSRAHTLATWFDRLDARPSMRLTAPE